MAPPPLLPALRRLCRTLAAAAAVLCALGAGPALAQDAEAYFLEGRRHLRADRPVQGEWFLQQAVRLAPRHYRAHLLLGRHHLEHGRLELAGAHLETARSLRPNSDRVHLLLGRIAEGRGDLLAAAEHYREAIRLNARQYEANRRLKAVLRRLREEKSVLERAGEQFWRRPNLANLTLYGRVVMAESSPRQALLEFESIRERLPGLAEVHLWVARAQRRLGHLEGEVAAYRAYLEARPDAHRIRLLLTGRLLDHGRVFAAEAVLQPVLDRADTPIRRPDADLRARSAYLQSRLALSRGEGARAGHLLLEAARFGLPPEEVDAAFGDFLDAYPELAALHLDHAYWLHRHRRYAEAARAFHRAASLAPGLRGEARLNLADYVEHGRAPDEAHLGLGELALAAGREAEAERHLAAIRPGHPADRRGALLLGVIRYRRDDLAGSLDALLRYVFAHEDPAAMTYARGNLLWELGQREAAEAVWGQAPALFHQHPGVLVRLARLYADQGNVRAELAARDLLRALEPQRMDNRLRLGDLLRQRGRLGEAVAQWQAVLERQPGRYDLRVRLGRVLLEQGRPASAVEHLQRAARLRPLPFELREALARALLRLERYEAALEAYWTIYRERPHHPDLPDALPRLALRAPAGPEVRLVAARMAEEQGRTAQAMELLEELIRRRPDHAEGRMLLAGLYLQENEPREAERVIAADGAGGLDDPERLRLLARAQRRLGNDAAAADTLARLAGAAPEELAVRRELGLLLADLERPGEAVPWLSEVVQARPEDREARLRLAHALWSLERYEAAMPHLRRVLADDPDHETALRLVIDRLLQQEAWYEVIDPLERWVASHPRDAVARHNLITAYLRRFDTDAARPHYHALQELKPAQARQLRGYFQ